MGKDAVGRRDEVLRVAARVFRTKGYRAATLNDIADEFGFTRAALYYYFASKQEILIAIGENAAVEMVRELDKALAGETPLREQIQRIFEGHARVVLGNMDTIAVSLAEKQALPRRIRDRLEAGEQQWVDRLAGLIQEGIDSGAISPNTPPKVTALSLLGMANWATRWYRRGIGVTPDEMAELIGRLAANGLGPPADEKQSRRRRPRSATA